MTILQEAADALQGGTYSRKERDELAIKLARLNARDGFTLTHALQIAAERFDADAATFDQIKAASAASSREGEPNEEGAALPMFNPVAAERLAAQFRRQAADVRELLAALQGDDEEEELERVA